MIQLTELHNACYITKLLLQQLQVPVTDIEITDTLENHPDFPALLCISDGLKKWKVENLAFKITTNELPQIETPFIAHTYTDGGLYVLVTNITATHISYTKGTGKNNIVTETIEVFATNFSGVVLAAEATNQSGQANYQQSLQQQKRKQAVLPATLAAVPIIIITSWLLYTQTIFTFSNIILLPIMLCAAIGLGVSILLVWYEVDKYNPTLQKICTGGQTGKANCDAIVNSKQGKLFNIISWGEVGFIYFAGYVLNLLMLPILGSTSIMVLVWLNIITLPYIVFSIYYQAVVAKQWCRLCLAVQGVFATMFICYMVGGFIQGLLTINVNLQTITAMFILFAIPTIGWYIIKPLWLAKQQNKNVQSSYNRLKYNTQVFEGLLQQQPQMLNSTTGMGLQLGNANAANQIVKVCNPYCGPCATAHKHLHDMLAQSPNANLQIIFTATTKIEDERRKPVQHLLAIQQHKNEWLHNALDAWYLQEGITYETFAKQYPMPENLLEQQLPTLEAMSNWCKQQHIIGTPTIYINGKQLPDAYMVQDIGYFIT
jgi:hypothetical protein